MKKRNLAIATLFLSALALSAQTQKPAADAAQQSTAAKGSSMDLDAPTVAPAAEQPGGDKFNPKAKTAAEGKDYDELLKLKDGAAALTAADAFAGKYADSTLLASAYTFVADQLRRENKTSDAIAAYRKSLGYDADNPFALGSLAELIAQTTHQNDLDLRDRAAEIDKLVKQAHANIDQMRNTKGHTPAEVASAKSYLLSQLYDAQGRSAYYTRRFALAEENFQKFIDVTAAAPDAVSYLLLGMSQVSQSKYEAAIATFDKGSDIAKKTQAEQFLDLFAKQKQNAQQRWEVAKQRAAAKAAAAQQQTTTPAGK